MAGARTPVGADRALLEATLGTQRDAALLLGIFKRPEAARPLVFALGDPDLRESAMQALAMIGAPAAETLAAWRPISRASCAPTPTRSCRASDRRRRTSRVLAMLAEALDDEASEAAAAAAAALGEVGDREALAPLLRALGARRRWRTRRPTRSAGSARVITTKCASSCRAAASAAPTRPISVARSAPAGAPRMRRCFKQALGAECAGGASLGGRGAGAAAALRRRRRGADLRARRRIGRRARLGGAGARCPPRRSGGRPLARCALEGEPLVRAAASRALGQVATVHARRAQPLRRVADSRDPAAAVPALEALARLDERGDDGRFIGGAASRSTARRSRRRRARSRRARTARPRPGEAAALVALERALADPRWDVRRQAALALADFGAVAPSVGPSRQRAGSAGAGGDRVGAGRCQRGERLMASAGQQRRLPPEIFRLLRDLIYDYCGIFFAEDNAYIMHRRLQPRLEALVARRLRRVLPLSALVRSAARKAGAGRGRRSRHHQRDLLLSRELPADRASATRSCPSSTSKRRAAIG